MRCMGCVFSKQDMSFSSPGLALLRTITMTTGEFEYATVFRQNEDGVEIAFPSISYVLWVVFIILMPILLTNLLVWSHPRVTSNLPSVSLITIYYTIALPVLILK